MAIEQEIRRYLAKRYKCDPNIDIQLHGDVVEVRGVMPNTQAYGQIHTSNRNDVEDAMRRERREDIAIEA